MKANENGTLEMLSEEWEEDPKKLVCEGCKSEITCHNCADCKIKNCNLEKDYEHCGQCPEFPCQIIRSFDEDKHAHHTGVLGNLEALKETPVETWLEAKSKRWQCGRCGARFYWYDEICPYCGEELYNSKKEDRDIKNANRD